MFNRQQRRFGYLMLIVVVQMLALASLSALVVAQGAPAGKQIHRGRSRTAGDSITRPKRDTNIIVVALQRQPQAAG
ncbi:MAG: hypothetical protein KJ065_16365 [Anaerolineae bacterium]|nr:hypothetical protein [Anaerolineae bacterium]